MQNNILPELCFSIITAERSLDLMAPTKRLRDAWVAFFRQMLERNNMLETIRVKTSRKEEREQRIHNTSETWVKEIIPHFQHMRHSKKVKQMWRLGIPPGVRSQVWTRAIGNPLNITQATFDEYNRIAVAARKKQRKGDMSGFAGLEDLWGQFSRDIPHTFPELRVFHDGGPLEDHLRDVVETFMFYRPSQGYVPGLSFIAGMLLLYCDVFESFVCLANLLYTQTFFTYPGQMNWRCEFFNELLEQTLPMLSHNLKSLHVPPDVYLDEWFLTIFCKHLSLDLATRVWDNFLLDGEIFLYRTALGIVSLLGHKLQKANAKGCLDLLQHTYLNVDETILFNAIANIPVTKSHAARLRELIHNKAKEKEKAEKAEKEKAEKADKKNRGKDGDRSKISAP